MCTHPLLCNYLLHQKKKDSDIYVKRSPAIDDVLSVDRPGTYINVCVCVLRLEGKTE